MSRFIGTVQRDLINLSGVAKIIRKPIGDGSVCEWRLFDFEGQLVGIVRATPQALFDWCEVAAFVTAPSGYHALRRRPGTYDFRHVPIVAWEFRGRSQTPLPADGPLDCAPIEYPNGEVLAGGESFKNLAAYVIWLRERELMTFNIESSGAVH